MTETVTVDQALARGHRMITFPTLGLITILIGFSIYISILKLSHDWIVFSLGFTLSIVLPWLYWSFAITKWRIWAFENVRNLKELKKRAIKENLIWPDNSVFNKTEIRTRQDRKRLAELELKFNHEDEFFDDLSVPNETAIYYDKATNLFEMLLMIFGLGFGVYLTATNSYILGPLIGLYCLYSAYNEYKQATDTTAQIIINEDGIQTISTKFQEWRVIRNEDVITVASGNKRENYLSYAHPNGQEELLIDDYNISGEGLRKLLVLYRGRNEKVVNRKLTEPLGWVISESDKLDYHTDLGKILSPIWEDVKDYHWLVSDLEFASGNMLPLNNDDEYSLLTAEQFAIVKGSGAQFIWGVFSGVPAHEKIVVNEDNLPYADGNSTLWNKTMPQHPNATIEIICFDSTETIVKFCDVNHSRKFKAYFDEAIAILSPGSM